MPYRVLVVDDSAFMRKIVTDLIEENPDFKVMGTAKNGREALVQIELLSPDIVTMDVEMPEMNGLDALKAIMQSQPLPVIMLSGINEEGMKETIMALELGAFDFIRKPSATTSSHDIEHVREDLHRQLRVAMESRARRIAREEMLQQRDWEMESLPPPGITPPVQRTKFHQIPVIGEPSGAVQRTAEETAKKTGIHTIKTPQKPDNSILGRLAGAKESSVTQRSEDKTLPPAKSVIRTPEVKVRDEAERLEPLPVARGPVKTGRTGFSDLVAIGTSTGGPKALKAVLEKIPGDFPAPVVIVQHMPPNFTKSLAQRLNSLSSLTVVEAEEGMELRSGTAYIAPGGLHLTVKLGSDGVYKLSLTKQPPRNGHRPSVDVMYESLLPLTSIKRHIVLLTGMGSDGAKVMKQLYDAGVTSTIAESEETCVVYGMPRSAVELKCVDHVLPLHEIGPKLVQIVK